MSYIEARGSCVSMVLFSILKYKNTLINVLYRRDVYEQTYFRQD